ncbi:MAG: M4 family metallopeptidase [Firmicutes bacterium]|nr:M4 family metallopeptidase [Bacillota bacterium]
MKKLLVLFLSLVLVVGLSMFPGESMYAGDSLQEFQARSAESLRVIRVEADGPPSFVAGILSGKLGASNESVAMEFLVKHKNFFEIANPTDELVAISTETDELGMTKVQFQQVFDGLPVNNNQLTVHFNTDNVVTAVNGRYAPKPEIETKPAIDELAAVAVAMEAVNAPEAVDYIAPRLIILPIDGKYYLAYEINLEIHTGETGNWFVFIDAHTGAILDKYDAMTGFAEFSDVLPIVNYTEPATTAINSPSPNAIANTTEYKTARGMGLGVKGDKKKINIVHNNQPGRQPNFEQFDATSIFSNIYNPVANLVEFTADNELQAVTYKADVAGEYTLNIKNTSGTVLQTHTVIATEAGWIEFAIQPFDVNVGDRYQMEITKPADARTYAQTGRYIGENWRNRDAYFGGLGWGYNYTQAMGFRFDGFTMDPGSKFYLADLTLPFMDGIFTYNLKNGSSGTDLYENTNASWMDVLYSGDSSSWEIVGQGPGVDAHAHARKTYEYYLENHGWNSVDNNGLALTMRVHYGNQYNNAFWSGGANYMTFGDGDGSYFIPLTALDVVAHELTHGITQFKGGLRYRFDTGAINEAFSDVFAVMVDTSSWDVGENIMGEDEIATGRTALRSNSDPGKFIVSAERIRYSIDGEGRYPAHMDEYYYLPQNIDNGGVHVNCTILQHSAYLVAEEYGMGRKVVADTWFRSYDYLHYDATFGEFREAILQSAIDLYGEDSEEYAAFLGAFDDIGLYEGWTRFDNPRPPLW